MASATHTPRAGAGTGGARAPWAAWAASWWATVALVVAVAALRAAYLAWWCPYTLLEDEAHYWEWSRRLDWSYYSKGPGVAWTIWASTRVFGGTELGVRMPAVVLAGLAALGAAGLARRATGEPRAGFFAAALMLLCPGFQLGGILMTIDMPYVAMWGLGAWAAWVALMERGRWAWVACAAALGAGFLYKYTALFALPGLALFVVLARGRLNLDPRWRRWAGAGAAIFLASLLPVLIWNAQHGWPTWGHLLGHLGIEAGDLPPPKPEELLRPPETYSPKWTLEFLGSQVALMGPVIVLMGLGAHRAWRLRRDEPERWTGRMYLLCLAGPILVSYLLLTFATEVEGNWAIAGYLPLIALAAWGVVEAMDRRRAGGRNVGQVAWHVTLVLGVFIGLAPLRLDWLAESSFMRWVDARLIEGGVMRAGRTLVPTGRLMGAEAMALDTAALGERLRRETGMEPLYLAEHYGRASLLAFYLPGRPIVYCSSSILEEGRPTQYDYWPDTRLDDPALLGRPAVLIGSKLSRWEVGFARVEAIGRLEHETKERRDTFLGYGYVGFRDDAISREDEPQRRRER